MFQKDIKPRVTLSHVRLIPDHRMRVGLTGGASGPEVDGDSELAGGKASGSGSCCEIWSCGQMELKEAQDLLPSTSPSSASCQAANVVPRPPRFPTTYTCHSPWGGAQETGGPPLERAGHPRPFL